MDIDLQAKEIEEAIEILKNPINVNTKEYKYFDKDNYDKLTEIYKKCLKAFDKYETLIELAKEHKILKQFIIDNGLWEKLLNDEKFLDWMKEDK